jgi:hypothetical protein
MRQWLKYDKMIITWGGVDFMPQENAAIDMNVEFGITVAERERYNDFLHIRYINEKLAEAEAFAAANPDAWRDMDDILAEWEEWEAVNL